MSSLKIASLNTQGLGDSFKRRDVFHYLRDKKFSIYFLQDTHFEKVNEKHIRAEWGYECFFASNNSRSRGVAILFNNNFDFKVKEVISDIQGNYIIVNLTTMERELTLVNIYGPNRDRPEFYELLEEKLQTFQNTYTIIAGDWNLVLNPDIDYCNYRHVNNQNAQEKVIQLIDDLQLVDIWREINPEIRRFTWRRPNPPQQSRLDFFLLSENLVTYVKDADILIGYKSDHSLISIVLEFKKENIRNTFWKFNSSHLKDKAFLDKINDVIKETKEQYAVLIYDRNAIENIPIEELQIVISDQLFLDTLLMEIRKATIEYGARKKRENNKKEESLEREILKLEQKYRTITEDQLLQEKNDRLIELRKHKVEGIILRSRATFACSGEKISKYYCNMENRHFVSKQMYKLISSKGITLNDTEEMLKETKEYYKNLYQKKVTVDSKLDEYVPTLPKLDEIESNSLEGLLTLEEASIALKNMKNGKSPGTDGITVEFFKVFWKQIGGFVVRSLNEGFKKGQMSITQKEGIIICLPKSNKPREYLKNWRPISLLNISYKIGSTCIANRIKQVLHSLINEDQTGFVSGRYMGDNLRFIYDLIHHLDTNNLPGLLVSIDFEKAFDCISWSYMQNVLNTFGFGDSLCQWVKAFYVDIKSYVVVNGKVSEKFIIERGCRQGDPISPYLFILCAEILACRIREDNNIKGIKIEDSEHKISQFADDTCFTLEGDKRSFETLFTTLSNFANMSGLKLNYSKTCNVWLGSKKNSDERFLNDLEMEWNPPKFKILGLWFTNDVSFMTEINIKDKLIEVKRLFSIWSKRCSTPLGRVAVLKSLILSKLIFLWILLPNPPDIIIKQLQEMSIAFVWDNKRDKIKRNISIHPIEEGGIDIPYIKAYIYSLKLTWLHKVFSCKRPKWMALLTNACPDINLAKFFGAGYFKRKNLNPFWRDVLDAYHVLHEKIEIMDTESLLAEPLFFNDRFTINKQWMNFPEWKRKNVYYVKDLLKEGGTFLRIEEFNRKYNINAKLLDFWGCINVIKRYIRANNIECLDKKSNENMKAFEIICKPQKGAKQYYKIILGKTDRPKACQNWDRILGANIQWSHVYLNTKQISEIKMRWFQIRINHRIIVTNSILKNMRVVENNTCNFCDREKDTVFHYLWQCDHVQTFWKDFENCLKAKCPNCDRLTLNASLVLFGSDGNSKTDECFLFILLHAKHFVYKCRINKCKPTMQIFLKSLTIVRIVDRYVHSLRMEYQKFVLKWIPYNALCELN